MGKLGVLSGPSGGAEDSPVGTKVLFQQTAAPTGWTKDTTHNDKTLRVVSGSAGSGGSQSFSSCFGAGKATQSHTLSTPQIASHTHTHIVLSFVDQADRHYGRSSGFRFFQNSSSPGGAKGGSGSHSHSLNLDIDYVDVIVATKE